MTESEKIKLPTPITPPKKYLAEFIGTMVLVLMGCGSAVIAGANLGGLNGNGTVGILLLSVSQCLQWFTR